MLNYKRGIMVFLTMGLASVAANAEFKIHEKTYGYEVGVEQQKEVVDDKTFVTRTYGRYLSTMSADVYRNDRGDNLNLELKAGAALVRYKGSILGSGDEYGSLTETRGGVISEMIGLYHFGDNKLRPFVGLDAKVEAISGPRIDIQADGLMGANYKISDTKTLGVEYHTYLARNVNYTKRDHTYTQDDGFGLAVFGKHTRPNGGTDTIRLEWEKLEESDMHTFSDGFVGYEPDADHILLSYKRTY